MARRARNTAGVNCPDLFARQSSPSLERSLGASASPTRYRGPAGPQVGSASRYPKQTAVGGAPYPRRSAARAGGDRRVVTGNTPRGHRGKQPPTRVAAYAAGTVAIGDRFPRQGCSTSLESAHTTTAARRESTAHAAPRTRADRRDTGQCRCPRRPDRSPLPGPVRRLPPVPQRHRERRGPGAGRPRHRAQVSQPEARRLSAGTLRRFHR